MNVLLEQSQGVGVGDHDPGGLVVHQPGHGVWVENPLVIGFDRDGREPAEGRAGGVGAVRRIGDEDLVADVAPRLESFADHEDPGELPVRAGRGLQGHPGHPGDGEQRLLELALAVLALAGAGVDSQIAVVELTSGNTGTGLAIVCEAAEVVEATLDALVAARRTARLVVVQAVAAVVAGVGRRTPGVFPSGETDRTGPGRCGRRRACSS